MATREALGLSAREFATLRRLSSPERVQAYLNAIPANHERNGETLRSVRGVLHHRVAHCMEGALVAACALWVHGEAPLLMHLDCAPHDNPHVLALFRRRGHWGALSKSNGAWLRYREPVYRNLRELAMSYFHEFFDRRGHKTLRGYTRPFDLRRVDAATWVTSESCWALHDRLAARRHYALVTAAQARALSRRDAHEREAARLVQYPKPGSASMDGPRRDN